jgi:hypothetical protein
MTAGEAHLGVGSSVTPKLCDAASSQAKKCSAQIVLTEAMDANDTGDVLFDFVTPNLPISKCQMGFTSSIRHPVRGCGKFRKTDLFGTALTHTHLSAYAKIQAQETQLKDRRSLDSGALLRRLRRQR